MSSQIMERESISIFWNIKKTGRGVFRSSDIAHSILCLRYGDIKTSLSQVRNGEGQIHMQLKLKGFFCCYFSKLCYKKGMTS